MQLHVLLLAALSTQLLAVVSMQLNGKATLSVCAPSKSLSANGSEKAWGSSSRCFHMQFLGLFQDYFKATDEFVLCVAASVGWVRAGGDEILLLRLCGECREPSGLSN